MVTVAVAGGGSTLGSNVIAAILASKHHLVVLSRSPRPDLQAQGATVHTVDYNSAGHVKEALEGVHTVISLIFSYAPDFADSELALLDGAKAAGVKRFVSSDWSINRYDAVDFYKPKGRVWDAVQKSGLEYTRFIPGFWMNLWGVGAPNDESDARAGYKGGAFLIDVENHTALIPGDGSQRVVFTEMRDVGKAVAASLDLPRWEPDSRIVGDNPTLNEVVQLAEKTTGHTFTKTHLSEPDINKMLAEASDPAERFMCQFQKLILSGAYDWEDTLKGKIPDTQRFTAEAFFRKYWANA